MCVINFLTDDKVKLHIRIKMMNKQHSSCSQLVSVLLAACV